MEIICGRQGTGKTFQLFERIKALPKTQKIYLIVPEQATFETECALLDALGAEGTLNVQVTGLKRFARKLAANTPLNTCTLITDDAKNLIVKNIIDTLAPSLLTYQKCADKKGFADDAVRLIGELKESLVAPDALEKAAADADEALKAKLADVLAIYARYNAAASGGRLDPDDYISACAAYADSHEDIAQTAFFFDSFHTFDASSYPLITQLIRCAADVCFTLTLDDGDFFEITQHTKDRLEQAASDAGRQVRYTRLSGKKGAAEELCFIEENITRYSTKRCNKPSPAVCLRECEDVRVEVKAAAAEICAYIREHGARFSDIGVAVSDLGVYAPVIEDVFARFGIPVYIDSRKSVAYFAPVRALLLMLKMAEKPFSTEDIIGFAKTGFAPAGYGECEDIENYCLQYGVKGYRWNEDFTFDPERGYDLNYINGIRQRLAECVQSFSEAFARQTTVGGQCRAAYAFVEKHLSEKIADYAQSAEEKGDAAAANTFVQVYNKMLDIIECAFDLFAQNTPEEVNLLSVLNYAFMCADIGTVPATLDTVAVGDIVRSRAPEVMAMFVLGLSEGAVPSVPRAGNVFTDSDKSQLKKSGVYLKNTSGYIIRKENFAFYTILCRPKAYLYVSSTKNEENARAFLFERLVTMFGLSPENKDALHYVVNKTTAYDLISEKYGEKDQDALLGAVFDYFKNDRDEPFYYDILKAGTHFTNAAEIRNTAAYDKLIGRDVRLSVTKLEKYAQCPFSFYSNYILRPNERRRFRIRRLDIGIVVHAVMDAFSQKLLAGQASLFALSEDETAALAQSLTHDALESYATGAFSEIAKSRYQTAKILRVVKEAIIETLRQLRLSDFHLSAAENTFANVAVDIAGTGRVLLEGKIDRIDIYETESEKYIKIIDYKTGGAKVDMKLIEAGIDLQLPVYIGVAAEAFGAAPAGFFYVKIRPEPQALDDQNALEYAAQKARSRFALCGVALDDVRVIGALDKSAPDASFISDLYGKNGSLNKSTVLSAQAFTDLIESANAHIRRLSDDILSAKIAVEPYRYGDKNACLYCAYAGICKFSESFCANRYRAVKKTTPQEEPA